MNDWPDPFEAIAASRDLDQFAVGQRVLWCDAAAVVVELVPRAAYQVRIRCEANGEILHVRPSELTTIPALETLEQVEEYLAG